MPCRIVPCRVMPYRVVPLMFLSVRKGSSAAMAIPLLLAHAPNGLRSCRTMPYMPYTTVSWGYVGRAVPFMLMSVRKGSPAAMSSSAQERR